MVIGQGSEYDFAVYQALKALREENYELVLVNSNPCAVSADTCFADQTYIEPLTLESVTAIIKKERPQAMLAVFGGQTALNLAVALDAAGVLKEYSIEMLGADMSAITRSEDKTSFKDTMKQIGVAVPRSGIADSIEDGVRIIKEIGYSCNSSPGLYYRWKRLLYNI